MRNVTWVGGYDRISIWVHWMTAALVIALFLTHEGRRGGAAYAFHVGVGTLAGVFFIWRIARRYARGLAPKPDQAAALNLVSRMVLFAILASIAFITVTGVILPWSAGHPLDIYGFAIPSPLQRHGEVHEALEETHEFLGHLLVPLVGLHILGALKHALWDRDRSVAARMFRATAGGR